MTLKVCKRCAWFNTVEDLRLRQSCMEIGLSFFGVFERFLNNPLDIHKPFVVGKVSPLDNCFRGRIKDSSEMH